MVAKYGKNGKSSSSGAYQYGAIRASAVNKLVKVPPDQYQFEALVDFGFNAGKITLRHLRF